jgi:hypothetical protein
MLERHQLHRRVSRADVIPCSLSQIPSGFAGLQGELILAFSLEEAPTFGRDSSLMADGWYSAALIKRRTSLDESQFNPIDQGVIECLKSRNPKKWKPLIRRSIPDGIF